MGSNRSIFMGQRIVSIEKEKCNGCGLCVGACAEGAIGMVDGRACLLREDYCDGLGNCLPVCPTGAIRFHEAECGLRGQPAQWPVQIKLVPVNAPFFNDADILVSADCCAYAYPHFHADFVRNKVVLIGCPKLDNTDYGEKLGNIIAQNNVKSVTVARMEVPCCGGIEYAARVALKNAGTRPLPVEVVVLSVDGKITGGRPAQ
jgi:ferredoxin